MSLARAQRASAVSLSLLFNGLLLAPLHPNVNYRAKRKRGVSLSQQAKSILFKQTAGISLPGRKPESASLHKCRGSKYQKRAEKRLRQVAWKSETTSFQHYNTQPRASTETTNMTTGKAAGQIPRNALRIWVFHLQRGGHNKSFKPF